jgi:hypothetical protein
MLEHRLNTSISGSAALLFQFVVPYPVRILNGTACFLDTCMGHSTSRGLCHYNPYFTKLSKANANVATPSSLMDTRPWTFRATRTIPFVGGCGPFRQDVAEVVVRERRAVSIFAKSDELAVWLSWVVVLVERNEQLPHTRLSPQYHYDRRLRSLFRVSTE